MLTFELPPINGPSVGQATVGVVDSSVQNTTYPIWRVPPDDAAQNAYEPDRQSGIAMIITHSSVGLGASDEEAYQQAVKALGLSWPRGLFEGKSCQPHRIEDPEVVAPDKRKLTSENVVRLLRAAQRQDAGKETLGSIVDDMQDAVPTWRQNCDTADNVPYLSTRSTSELQDEVVPWLKRTSNISPGSWITAGEQR